MLEHEGHYRVYGIRSRARQFSSGRNKRVEVSAAQRKFMLSGLRKNNEYITRAVMCSRIVRHTI